MKDEKIKGQYIKLRANKTKSNKTKMAKDMDYKTVAHKNCGGAIQYIRLINKSSLQIECLKCGESWEELSEKLSSSPNKTIKIDNFDLL